MGGATGYSRRSDKVNSSKTYYRRRWKIMDKLKVLKKVTFSWRPLNAGWKDFYFYIVNNLIHLFKPTI